LQRNSLWIRSRTCTYTILQTIRALASIKICTTSVPIKDELYLFFRGNLLTTQVRRAL
jgi:hypothetical protein